MTFEEFCVELESIIRASGEALEGNCVYYDQTLTEFPELKNKRQNLIDVAGSNDKPTSKIIEIGFNAGHSALLLMLNAPTADFTFCDLGAHRYTKPCYDFISGKLPDVRQRMFYGDSRITLPLWIAAHADEIGTFDVVHVDGGHFESCVVSDLAMAVLLVRQGGTVIVDDTNDAMILSMHKLWEDCGVLERQPQWETPDNTYAHIVARRTFKAG